MTKIFRKSDPFIKIVNSALVDLPSPSNISYMWNFGSILGLCLFFQIATGLILTMHFSPSIHMAFSSVVHIVRDVNHGWFIRNFHITGASLFFSCMFIHIGRGIYYGSYKNIKTWYSGVILFICAMVTAFFGYVLPWGQMSFWAATVITNLLSAVPMMGTRMVETVWGGFSVGDPTLKRFLVLHFLVPFLMIAVSLTHLLFLHETGSSNPMGMNPNLDKVPFHPYFSFKDILGFLITLSLIFLGSTLFPYLTTDPDNFTQANSLVTPPHIKPEWYFLFAYAILRAIPNKLMGVFALIMSLSVLLFMPFLIKSNLRSLTFQPFMQFTFWLMISNFILLSWLGAMPLEFPYTIMSQVTSFLYFFIFLFLFPLVSYKENKYLNSRYPPF
uniref:Cytochrome b n=1 Tax=Myxine glutinosa TaxID=7769 RepID=A0A7G7XPX6_MYXGL|nr:cytochrome b [Myxine glutinosa]